MIMAESAPTITVGVELKGTYAIDTKTFWLDLLDRTGKTFVQTLLIFLAGGATIASVSWTTALSSAALAALVSFLIALSTSTALTSGNFLIDLADRVGRTFVSALVGAIPATGPLSDINWRDALTLAATAAFISVLTSLASSNLGPTKGLPSLAPVQPELIALDDALVEDDSRRALRDDTRREIDIVTAKVFNTGKVFAADLDELNMAGVPILRLLAEELGVDKPQVRNLVAEGRVNYGALVRALGRFNS